MPAELIAKIKIKKLFGLYTYDIPQTGTLPDSAIIYGDNGVGKSTLLRLVFHLLSAADNRSHRGTLYDAEFERLEVELSSGISLTASVVDREPLKVLSLQVLEGDRRLAVWEYSPRDEARFREGELVVELDERGRHLVHRRPVTRKKEPETVPRGEQAYLEALKRCVPTLFILTADGGLTAIPLLTRVMKSSFAAQCNTASQSESTNWSYDPVRLRCHRHLALQPVGLAARQ